jgi:hypothetical protein
VVTSSLKTAQHQVQADADPSTATARTIPDRPKNRWALFVCLVASIGVIAATVLLANDSRNLKSLQSWLGFKKDVDHVVMLPSVRPTERTSPIWPFVRPGAIGALSAPIRPATTCALFATTDPDAPPAFVMHDEDWECALLTAPIGTGQSILFLQARGAASDTRYVRTKFNLNDGRMTKNLSAEALRFAKLFLPSPIVELELADKIEAKLIALEDFSLFVDGYNVTFRRELNDPSKGNLIFSKRTQYVGDLPRLTGQSTQ